MTVEELKIRQGWTLYQKIDHAVGAIEAFISSNDRVPYVSFSGGKDSTVLLNIVRRFIDRDIKAVFCNTGNEYPEIVRFVRSIENITIIRPEMTVKQVIDKYGFPIISKEQAKGIRQLKTTKSEKLRNILLYGTDPKKGWKSGKVADWLEGSKFPFLLKDYLRKDIAFGFTLTGCDEEEAGASMNIERVFAMKKLHDAGFKVWASIEPVIDIPKSMAMINLTSGFCDLYKVGLLSEKRFNATDLSVFIEMVTEMYPNNLFYFKETLINQAKIDRNSLPKNCVTSDYNLFTNN